MGLALSTGWGASVRGAGPNGTGLRARLAELAHACSSPNLGEAQLVERAIARGEGHLSSGGALVVDTGQHTGRSPKDKFVVREPATEDLVWWENNGAIRREAFQRLFDDVLEYVAGADLFVQDLIGGADAASRLRVRVHTEYAWHSLFIRNLLIRPAARELDGFEPEMTIIDVPGFKVSPERYGVRSETVIAFDLVNRLVLIAGTAYAGEMKKSVFTMLNCLLPEHGIMPMHCSANVGPDGRSALFFGLSGTGKTTLSATADRTLVGDDEHGWGDDGIFNFEGGCYAKTIRLSAAAEPQIHAAALRFGTVLENVSVDPRTRMADFDDDTRTENTRAAYPLPFISNASVTGRAGHPSNVVMLTADAFGVLPPIARLTPEQAVYHFLSGFTAKLAGTERGVTEPQPTFSTCFGAPFLPLPPQRYAELLEGKIRRHAPTCWLVNTGWTGGPYGVGHRMRIDWTRALLDAALGGGLAGVGFRRDPVFGFDVPVTAAGIPAESLDPRQTWPDPEAYDAQARRLAGLFKENFSRFDGALGRFAGAGPVGI